MANNYLKVNRAEYEARIIQLQGYLNKLDATITQYESKEREITSFMAENDDNLEKLRADVVNNIKTVRTARSLTQNSIDMLRQTLDSFTEAQANVGTILTDAGELAKNTVKGAIEVIKLVD